MKKTLLLSALAVVLSLTACNKEVAENSTPAPVPSVGQTVRFTSVAPETKAAFTTPEGTHYPVLWTANDTEMSVTMNYSSSPATVGINRSPDNKTASFKASFDNEGTEFTFVAVSPAASVKSVNQSEKKVNLEVPAGQTPTATSPDEKAMVLYAKSDKFDTFPDNVAMTFHHFTGYFHLVFTNYADALADAGATVQSVSISSDKEIAGRVFFFPESRATEGNAMSKTVTVTTSSLDDVWVALAPVDLSNETISIVIGTDKGTISKDVRFSSGCNLTSGKIAMVTVDMNGIDVVAPVRYNLVTNANQLHVGDKVMIVAANSDVAMSTTQNTHNRGQISVSKSEGYILDPSDAVEIVTLEDGIKPGEYALKAKAGYLYAENGISESGKNYLNTSAAINPSYASYYSFEISILPDGQTNGSGEPNPTNNVAQVYANTNARGLIRYNKSSSLFSAYATSTSVQFIHLYRLNQDAAPHFKASMPDADGENNVSVDAAGGVYKVYVFGDTPWTASVSGGATLSATSGTGNTILDLTVPANAGSSPKAYSVTVSTTAGVVPSSYTFNLTQGTALSLGAILFEDDFEWLQPYVDAWLAANTKYTEDDLDPVGQNVSSHQQPNIWNVNDLATTLGVEFETTRGYTDLNKSAKTLYLQHNYFKMGASGKQTGIKLPAISFGTTPRDVMLSFDWCAHMNASTPAVVDNTPIIVVLEGAGTCDDSDAATSNSIVSGQPASTLEWQHVTLRLNNVTNDTRISIKPNHDGFTWSGQHRWHLDNLKVQEIN